MTSGPGLFIDIVRGVRSRINERRRAIDLEILWPICKEKGESLDHAKAAFAYHAYHDRAWRDLGEDEIARRIDALS